MIKTVINNNKENSNNNEFKGNLFSKPKFSATTGVGKKPTYYKREITRNKATIIHNI